jgi:hypothetical protein
MSYAPIPISGQIVNSGEVLASGESIFADFDTQVPGLNSGINSFYKDAHSGVLFLERDRNTTLGISGINDSVFAPIFDYNSLSSSSGAIRNNVDLSVFKPYVHYYQRAEIDTVSMYNPAQRLYPFLVDYSLVFNISTPNPGPYNFLDVDDSGNPIFINTKLIPPN